MSLLKTNEIQNYNGSSLTLTASTVSTSAQLNTGGNISVTGSLNVSDDSTTRTNLGLGTIATQDSDSITVTGGTATLGALTVSGSDSGDLVRITQTGSGNALVVEDSANPDSTPLVVDASGNLLVGKTITAFNVVGAALTPVGEGVFKRNGAVVLYVNRGTDDGDLIRLFQADTLEGNISVSGSTVSYNGGHLSRFSQLSDNTRDESIVKGTVMSNLNQMAEWTNDGITEDNEQLNCMKVSDVEGDINVAGVFVNWDNDDDIYTNDMNIAMTGDMVIRIAQGTTVQRGDLLMSAGDGTAKPQGDDIVRSKTIAKVVSTHVSNTYEDGSYVVPCVLMAC